MLLHISPQRPHRRHGKGGRACPAGFDDSQRREAHEGIEPGEILVPCDELRSVDVECLSPCILPVEGIEYDPDQIVHIHEVTGPFSVSVEDAPLSGQKHRGEAQAPASAERPVYDGGPEYGDGKPFFPVFPARLLGVDLHAVIGVSRILVRAALVHDPGGLSVDVRGAQMDEVANLFFQGRLQEVSGARDRLLGRAFRAVNDVCDILQGALYLLGVHEVKRHGLHRESPQPRGACPPAEPAQDPAAVMLGEVGHLHDPAADEPGRARDQDPALHHRPAVFPATGCDCDAPVPRKVEPLSAPIAFVDELERGQHIAPADKGQRPVPEHIDEVLDNGDDETRVIPDSARELSLCAVSRGVCDADCFPVEDAAFDAGLLSPYPVGAAQLAEPVQCYPDLAPVLSRPDFHHRLGPPVRVVQHLFDLRPAAGPPADGVDDVSAQILQNSP